MSVDTYSKTLPQENRREMAAAARFDWATVAIALFFLLLMPCAILLSGLRMVPPPGSIDPWLYVGGFLNLEDLYRRFGGTYYLSRLPWLLLGKGSYSLFPIPVAHALTGFVAYFLCVGSLGVITRRYYRFEIAVFVCAVAATNPLLIFHAFWGHVDVPSIAVALASVASLIYAEGQRTTRMGILAGGLFAIAVTTHLFSVVVFAPAALVVFFVRSREKWSNAFRLCFSAIAGFLAGIGILGVVGLAVYGSFLFWRAQLRTARWVVGGGWHNWAQSIGDWVPGGALIIPLALICASLLLLIRYREIKRDAGASFLFPYIWIILGIFLITDFGMGGARLQHPWYYVFLVVPALLLLGPLLHHTIGNDRTIRICWIVYACLAVAALLIIGNFNLRYALSFSALALFPAALISLLLLVVLKHQIVRASAAVTLSCLLFLGCAYGRELRAVFVRTDQWKNLTQAVEIYRYVLPNLEEQRAVRFFYNNKPDTGYLFNSVHGLYLWGFSMLSNELPEIRENRRKHLNRPTSVVILAKNDADVDAGLKLMNELYDVEYVVLRETLVSRDEEFLVTIVHARPLEP